jgi:hypothetical protein
MSPLLRTVPAVLFVAALAGCSGKGGQVGDFTPPEANARKALEAALTHWQSGGQPGAVPGTAPVVQVIDSKWKAGQQLKSYEITGEEPVTGSGPRTFRVRLNTVKGPPVDTRYAVLGIDPLMVYRDEDFQKLSGTGQ